MNRLPRSINTTKGFSHMRALLARETQDVRAAEAVALSHHQVKKWIGAFGAALGDWTCGGSLVASEKTRP
jgi:hypothetical protein